MNLNFYFIGNKHLWFILDIRNDKEENSKINTDIGELYLLLENILMHFNA